ncbi:MAG: hypothetical protein GY703_17260 [Gammaproteobacteria bacterium]|nr:hypothetical protein [Gammaproteobacteria bacterium]
MIRVRAHIKLYIGAGKRRTPFTSGYRPLFDVLEDTKTSGMITLLDRDDFGPGDEGVVEIKFINANCEEGTRFHIYESVEPLGEGFVLELLETSS